MLPQGGDAHLPVHARGGHTAPDMADAVSAHHLGPVFQPLARSAEHRAHRGLPPQGGEHGIVSVQNQQAVLFDIGQQLALGLKNIFPAAQPLDMGVSDVGDHAHVGPDDVGQVIDFTQLVHAHLHHAQVIAPVQAQQGQRQPHIIIEVSFRL